MLSPGTGAERRLSSLSIPADARHHLAADLDRGYAVILADGGGLSALNAAAAWWRVDPRTGETLAIGSDGRGPTGTEYVIKNTLMGGHLSISARTSVGVSVWPVGSSSVTTSLK